MTKRAYYENGALECEATVLRCRAMENGFEILTDVTSIFPESGGQLSDTGFIGDAHVTHAREEGSEVWHLCDKAVEAGAKVKIVADAGPRLDHTQQHSGEHILSGMASKLFGAKNVGFHMAEDYATIDLDTQLTHEQIKELQREANRAVQRNVPVTYETVQGEELENIRLRKQAKGLKGDIRIVYFDGGEVDSCTCCGTHVAFSGEVGYIKITAHIKYKGGTRIWFACGMRAVEDSLNNQDIVDSLAVRFSAKQEDVLNAVLRQGDELTAARHQLKERTEKLNEFIAAELLGGDRCHKTYNRYAEGQLHERAEEPWRYAHKGRKRPRDALWRERGQPRISAGTRQERQDQHEGAYKGGERSGRRQGRWKRRVRSGQR